MEITLSDSNSAIIPAEIANEKVQSIDRHWSVQKFYEGRLF